MPESSSGKEIFACECGREFSSERGLSIHKRYCDYSEQEEVKETKEEVIETKPGIPKFECMRCGKEMELMRDAGMSKEFKCKHCGKIVAKF